MIEQLSSFEAFERYRDYETTGAELGLEPAETIRVGGRP